MTGEASIHGPKPISTSSPAGLAAAQMVTPGKLSRLLLEKGPLAIRHITQTLGNEIPSFKDLSSSKQRRLIMSAMEGGDREGCVVFEKIGWGQWSAKVVEAANFTTERELTNAANAKIKDMVAQESQRRRSSGTHKGRRAALASRAPDGVVYIDENALASEDEDEEDEDEDEGEDEDEELKNEDLYSFRRRKSSVVFGDSSPEGVEHELLAQRVRPLLKGRRSRRSSSKIRNVAVFKPGGHLDLPANGAGASQLGQAATQSSSLTRNNSATKIDLEQLSNSLSEPTSRRESRVSSSKESSIRSTLLPHKNYHWIPTSSPRLSYQSMPQVPQVPPLLSSSQANYRKKQHAAKPTDKHSDTDEEDWASIGAASLRNNSVPPKMDTVATSPNGFVAPKVLDTAEVPDIDHALPPPALDDAKPAKAASPAKPAKPAEDSNDAAILLMSLKS